MSEALASNHTTQRAVTTYGLRALERLPEFYSRALRLADDGHLPAEIARRLEMEISAVGPLLEVAKLKLADAMQALAVDEGVGSDPDDAAGPR